MKKALLLGVAGLALAGWATAQGPARRADRGERPEQAQAKLGLNEQQMEQLHKLRTEHRKAEIQRRADLAVAKMELNELFRAAAVDEKAVAARLKVVGDLEAAGLKARVDQRLALRRIVTAEQAEAIERMVAGRRRGPGPEGRPAQGKRGGQRRLGQGAGWDPTPEPEDEQ